MVPVCMNGGNGDMNRTRTGTVSLALTTTRERRAGGCAICCGFGSQPGSTHRCGEVKSHLHTVSRFLLSTATFLLAERLRRRCIPMPSDAMGGPVPRLAEEAGDGAREGREGRGAAAAAAAGGGRVCGAPQ